MPAPNPYESPQSDQARQAGRVVKRLIGVVTVGLLTPVAVVATGLISCGVSQGFADSAVRMDWGQALIGALAIFLLPPLAVLIGMVWWAVSIQRQFRDKPKDRGQDDQG